MQEADKPSKGMATVAMIVSPSIGCAVITEEHHACVVAFRIVCQKVKEGIVIQEKVVRVTSLRADDIWALDWVSAEEDGLATRH